ncbi:conjugal transfer protein [Streptomyces sp. NPDC051907]|uniref:conjugal transfer protein n=1 Tax=Streptomyces sp. NPDC051907 TaxID=3155284 RepID=UPI003415E1EF
MPARIPGGPAVAAPPAPSPPLRTPIPSLALRTVRRRVRIARLGVWAALAAGPVALAVACALPRAALSAAQPRTAAPSAVRTADPAGAAELFCDLWLRSDAGEADSSAAQAVRRLAPSVALPTRSRASAAQSLQRTVAVRSVRRGDGSWSVVVAAQFAARESGGGSSEAATLVRYFAVPLVAADEAGGSGAFTVTAAPAHVAGPGKAKAPESPFVDPLPADGALVSSLEEFFAAYLTGVGEVERYLSPGAQLTAVEDSGYARAVVDRAAADSEAAGGAVPGDGTVVRVQAQVTAADSRAARWPLVYTLTMAARSGRWEVTGLEAGAPAEASAVKSSPPARRPIAGGAAR